MIKVSLSSAVLLGLVIGVQPANAARIEPWNSSCLKDYRQWKKQPKHKAFAVTKVYSNGQGCGSSWSWQSAKAARQDALRQCVKRLRKERPGSKDRCFIIESR
jgi:hypothetical protein